MAYEGCLANKEGRHKREIETLKSALEEIEEIIRPTTLLCNLLSVDKQREIKAIINKAKEQE